MDLNLFCRVDIDCFMIFLEIPNLRPHEGKNARCKNKRVVNSRSFEMESVLYHIQKPHSVSLTRRRNSYKRPDSQTTIDAAVASHRFKQPKQQYNVSLSSNVIAYVATD